MNNHNTFLYYLKFFSKIMLQVLIFIILIITYLFCLIYNIIKILSFFFLHFNLILLFSYK